MTSTPKNYRERGPTMGHLVENWVEETKREKKSKQNWSGLISMEFFFLFEVGVVTFSDVGSSSHERQE